MIPCRRCLLRDIDKDEYFKNIYEYIESLDEDLKTEAAEYERRLSVCKLCENLINGMCKKCGCFVEVRAVKKASVCPVGHWGACAKQAGLV